MNTELDQLYQRYIDNTCSEEEREAFLLYVAANPDDPRLVTFLDETWHTMKPTEIQQPLHAEVMLKEILTQQEPAAKTIKWYRYAAAASIVIALGIATYFYTLRNERANDTGFTASYIEPGTNKATLTLANGQVIGLDKSANGKIAEEAGIKISKTTNGELVYEISDNRKLDIEALNTISTPRGGQYQVNLPDGTKIWLNAASSLKYPARFNGKDRRVQLSGEAYFEVSKDKAHPFIVVTDKQEVRVLGTHFNINSYADEGQVKTTLVEGSVKVSLSNNKVDEVILKPGQQSALATNRLLVNQVDTEEIVAWKNGYFQFNESNLESIMRQISRWYDIDITFEGKPNRDLFHFKVPRNFNLNDVLKIFEINGINFKIEGRTLIVKS